MPCRCSSLFMAQSQSLFDAPSAQSARRCVCLVGRNKFCKIGHIICKIGCNYSLFGYIFVRGKRKLRGGLHVSV